MYLQELQIKEFCGRSQLGRHRHLILVFILTEFRLRYWAGKCWSVLLANIRVEKKKGSMWLVPVIILFEILFVLIDIHYVYRINTNTFLLWCFQKFIRSCLWLPYGRRQTIIFLPWVFFFFVFFLLVVHCTKTLHCTTALHLMPSLCLTTSFHNACM